MKDAKGHGSDAHAAATLASGPKSVAAPVHDSMLHKYWENARARGDSPKPVYAVSKTQYWSVNKRQAMKEAEKHGAEVTRIDPPKGAL